MWKYAGNLELDLEHENQVQTWITPLRRLGAVYVVLSRSIHLITWQLLFTYLQLSATCRRNNLNCGTC